MQCSEMGVNINEAHFSPATHSGFPLPLMHFLEEGVGGFHSPDGGSMAQ